MARSQTSQKGLITFLGAILNLKTAKCLIHRLTAPPHNIKHCRLAFPHNQDPKATIRDLDSRPSISFALIVILANGPSLKCVTHVDAKG